MVDFSKLKAKKTRTAEEYAWEMPKGWRHYPIRRANHQSARAAALGPVRLRGLRERIR